MSNFDIVDVKKNDEMKDISNEDLAVMAQQDLDEYRLDCLWSCLSCGNEMTYSESLELQGKKYVHSIKCNNEVMDESTGKTKKCRKEMILKHSS